MNRQDTKKAVLFLASWRFNLLYLFTPLSIHGKYLESRTLFMND